ncbi:MAG: hypothetical protein AAFW81_05925 [Pseudomonadota bacterium]
MLSKALSDASYSWEAGPSGVDAYAVNGLNQYVDVDGASPAYDGPAREGAQTESPPT